MRIVIAAVGRMRADPAGALYDHYVARLGSHVFAGVTLAEVEARRALSPAKRVEEEARLLTARIPEGATLVALDPRGRQLTSEAFAAFLGAERDAGTGDLAFLIGGAEGLDPALAARARLRLAFGKVTWPHLLARALLAEQLYRAQAILTGHPYHRV